MQVAVPRGFCRTYTPLLCLHPPQPGLESLPADVGETITVLECRVNLVRGSSQASHVRGPSRMEWFSTAQIHLLPLVKLKE